MESYNKTNPCPKCGSKDALVWYCNQKRYDCGYHQDEVMHRECKNCHFKWNEKPLDRK